MLGDGSAFVWRSGLQLISGMENSWKLGLVLGFALEPLHWASITRLLERGAILCISTWSRGQRQLNSFSIRLLSVQWSERARVAFRLESPVAWGRRAAYLSR